MTMSFKNESTIYDIKADDESDGRPVYTIEDLGIRANPTTQQTIIGPTRSIYSLTRNEKIYLLLSIICSLTSMGLTIDRLKELNSSDPDFTFAFLLFWTTIFSIFYIIQGIFRERAFELIAFVATVSIVWIYVIINYTANSNHTLFKNIRLGITCFIGPTLIIPGLYYSKKYFESKNLIFRTVGANASIQKSCELLFLASSLLKFDTQLAGSALILWLRKGFSKWTQTDILTISFGSTLTLIWITLGFLSMRFEKRIIVFIFLLISIFEPTIIVWNLVRYSLDKSDSLVLEISVYLTSIIALIIRLITIIVMIFVMFNFNQGLKDKVYGNKSNPITSSITNSQVFDN